jgi:hypothetical protein
LGESFEELLDHLKTPLLHSLEAFLLPDTHDRIRCFREALRSGPGLMVKRDRAKEPDFWDWPASKVKDMTLVSFELQNHFFTWLLPSFTNRYASFVSIA